MQIIIAIISGIGALLNYMWYVNGVSSEILRILSLVLQGLLTVGALAALISYRGKRTRKKYLIVQHPRIFRLGFSIIILSVVGNACILGIIISQYFIK